MRFCFYSFVIIQAYIVASKEEKESTAMNNRPPFPVPPFMTNPLPAGSAAAGKSVRPSWSVAGEMVCGNANITRSLQVEFPEPATYTVQFSKTNPPDPFFPIPNVTTAEATVIWHVAGNVIQRVVSVDNGISISGNADGVQVVIRDTTTSIPAQGSRYQVAATVVKGLRGSTHNPPFLFRNGGVFSIDGGTGQQFTLPENAGVNSVQVLVASPNGAVIPDNLVQVRQLTGGTILKQYDPRNFAWVTMAPGARNVVIDNLAAPGFFMVVSLTWGIDG